MGCADNPVCESSFKIKVSCNQLEGRNKSWNRDKFFRSSLFSQCSRFSTWEEPKKTVLLEWREGLEERHLEAAITEHPPPPPSLILFIWRWFGNRYWRIRLYGGRNTLPLKEPLGNPKPQCNLCAYFIHRIYCWISLQLKGFLKLSMKFFWSRNKTRMLAPRGQKFCVCSLLCFEFLEQCMIHSKNWIFGGLVQDGGVEVCELTPSCESTGITTNCWTIIDRKTLELTKKYPTFKEKGEATMRRYEGRNHNKIKSHNCWVGDSQTGEHLYHRSPPTGMKILSPTSGFPTWGSSNGRRNSQRIRLWRLVGFDCRTLTRLGETETPLLEDTHKVVCTSGPKGKEQWPHRRLNQT